MIRLHQLIFLTLFLTAILPFTFRSARAQTQDFVRICIVNPLTGDSTFNVSDRPVGSAFTMEFYVGNVTDMVTWQIHLTYNRTLIHYAKAWFPSDNVFKEAIDKGAIPIKGISNNVDNATDVGDLLIIMTCTYPPDTLLKYPVSVASKGLLCKVNFTIALHPTYTQLVLGAEQQQNPPSLHVAPPYYLTGYRTSVETLNGTYPAGGDSAVIDDLTPVPESSTLLLLVTFIVASLSLIMTRKRLAGSYQRKRVAKHLVACAKFSSSCSVLYLKT